MLRSWKELGSRSRAMIQRRRNPIGKAKNPRLLCCPVLYCETCLSHTIKVAYLVHAMNLV